MSNNTMFTDLKNEIISLVIITVFIILISPKKIQIILFLLVSNGIYIFISTFLLNKTFNLSNFFNIININIFILFLGFIYKTIFFLPLKIDFFYYFSLKDYILIVFQSTLVLIYFGFILFFMILISNFIFAKKKYTFFSSIIFLILYFILIFIFNYCLFNPLNIKIEPYSIYSSLISFYYLKELRNINIIKNLDDTFNYFQFLKKNKFIALFFILIFFINSSFLKIYTILEEEEETLIKKNIEYKIYKDKKIFKIDSNENYDFYISKPNNESLIFERDYNIIKK